MTKSKRAKRKKKSLWKNQRRRRIKWKKYR